MSSALQCTTILAFVTIVCICLSQKPADPLATKETVCLYQNLYNISRSNSIIFGHYEDFLYGQHFYDKSALENKSDVVTAIGEYPGFVEYNILSLINNAIKPEYLANHIYVATQKGLAFGWKWEATNPVTGGNAHDTKGNVIQEIMPGGTANKLWLSWLDTFANFVKNVTLPNGNLIPMLMRPFHENTGDWYWWGANFSTPQQFKAAYNYTRSYLVDQHGLHNLLFVYAPAKPYKYYDGNVTEYGTDRYPGNDIMDICGFDAYDPNDFHVELINNTRMVVEFALSKENDKIATISEFGVRDGTQNTNIESWWMTAVYNPIYADDEAYKVGYMTSWQDLSPNMWWTPLPGNVTYTSFVQLHQQKNILFQKGVPKFFQC